MILQEEFIKSGYVDILVGNNTSDSEINLEGLFSPDRKPEELLSIYLSKQEDEMFFLLNGDAKEMTSLCKSWDERIRAFAIIHGKSEAVLKIKYNIVQLIVCSKGNIDKSVEGNLLISRKILISGDLSDKEKIKINNDEVVELPFYMIPENSIEPDKIKTEQLNQLLPQDPSTMELMREYHAKAKANIKDGKYVKAFKESEFVKIQEWLEG